MMKLNFKNFTVKHQCVELSERAFTGVGISMVILSTFIAWYYNMVVGWALYYFTNSMQSRIISIPYVES